MTNFVGRSCFGTDELQKTLPIGVNIACPGTCPNDYSQVFKNMASRLSIGGSTRLPTTPGGTQNFQFISMGGQGSQVPNVFEGVGVTGYFAIGYDDEYITNGGSQTPQLKIISDDPGLGVVTQITSCDNPGTGGLGQYYLFQVTSTGINPNTGMPCFNVPLDLQYPSGSGSRWITGSMDSRPRGIHFHTRASAQFRSFKPVGFVECIPESGTCRHRQLPDE